MARRTIRSRLVKYLVSAKDTVKGGETVVWTVLFQANRLREDRTDWLNMARSAGFANISLTKIKDLEKV